MEARKFVVYNQTRDTTLSSSVAVVNAALEPLKVLKVLIEGLPAAARSGLWLTNFKGVPVARTLSPFDLIYLDKENRVLHGVELSKDGEFAPFRGRPASALVLPSRSLKNSETREGDQLELQPIAAEAQQPEIATLPAAEAPPIEPKPAVAATIEQPMGELSPSAQFFSPLPSPSVQIPVPTEESPGAFTDQGEVSDELSSTQVEPPLPAKHEVLPAANRLPFEPASAQDFFIPTQYRAEPQAVEPPAAAPLGEETEARPTPGLDATGTPESALQISQPSSGRARPKRRAPEPLPIQEAQLPASQPRSYGPPQKQKHSWKVRLLRWLFPHLVIQDEDAPVDRRRADRQSLPGLVAYFFTGGSPEAQRISNISVTGFYLQTDERWMPGTVVRMTLQRLGTKGDDPADTITVNSRIVRWGSDGEGFEFILTDLEE
jgi:hypothetical protein